MVHGVVLAEVLYCHLVGPRFSMKTKTPCVPLEEIVAELAGREPEKAHLAGVYSVQRAWVLRLPGARRRNRLKNSLQAVLLLMVQLVAGLSYVLASNGPKMVETYLL